jgi:hypothetical protein
MNAQATKLQAAENDLKQLMADVTRAMEKGRFVHGSVLTVVGQDSMPISTAIRSLRQNSSSWFRRRASNVPSSNKALFGLVMVPPKNRVGDAVTLSFPHSRKSACQ